MCDQEWISESELADKLNVNRSVLRKERPNLAAGEVSQKNGAVMWLKAAAARVSGALGVTFAQEHPFLAKKTQDAPSGAQDEGVELVTVVTLAVNPNIVNARRLGGQVVPVRVVDNRKYVPLCADGTPMTFPAKKSDHGNWWVLVGREPRWVGKF